MGRDIITYQGLHSDNPHRQHIQRCARRILNDTYLLPSEKLDHLLEIFYEKARDKQYEATMSGITSICIPGFAQHGEMNVVWPGEITEAARIKAEVAIAEYRMPSSGAMLPVPSMLGLQQGPTANTPPMWGPCSTWPAPLPNLGAMPLVHAQGVVVQQAPWLVNGMWQPQPLHMHAGQLLMQPHGSWLHIPPLQQGVQPQQALGQLPGSCQGVRPQQAQGQVIGQPTLPPGPGPGGCALALGQQMTNGLVEYLNAMTGLASAGERASRHEASDPRPDAEGGRSKRQRAGTADDTDVLPQSHSEYTTAGEASTSGHGQGRGGGARGRSLEHEQGSYIQLNRDGGELDRKTCVEPAVKALRLALMNMADRLNTVGIYCPATMHAMKEFLCKLPEDGSSIADGGSRCTACARQLCLVAVAGEKRRYCDCCAVKEAGETRLFRMRDKTDFTKLMRELENYREATDAEAAEQRVPTCEPAAGYPTVMSISDLQAFLASLSATTVKEAAQRAGVPKGKGAYTADNLMKALNQGKYINVNIDVAPSPKPGALSSSPAPRGRGRGRGRRSLTSAPAREGAGGTGNPIRVVLQKLHRANYWPSYVGFLNLKDVSLALMTLRSGIEKEEGKKKGKKEDREGPTGTPIHIDQAGANNYPLAIKGISDGEGLVLAFWVFINPARLDDADEVLKAEENKHWGFGEGGLKSGKWFQSFGHAEGFKAAMDKKCGSGNVLLYEQSAGHLVTVEPGWAHTVTNLQPNVKVALEFIRPADMERYVEVIYDLQPKVRRDAVTTEDYMNPLEYVMASILVVVIIMTADAGAVLKRVWAKLRNGDVRGEEEQLPLCSAAATSDSSAKQPAANSITLAAGVRTGTSYQACSMSIPAERPLQMVVIRRSEQRGC